MINTMTPIDYTLTIGCVLFAIAAIAILFATRPMEQRAFVRDGLLYRDMVSRRPLVLR